MDSKQVSFVLRSKNRRKILNLLKDSEKTPTELIKSTNMYPTHIHRTIRELKSKNLIETTNPEDNVYKFYKITKKGKETLKDVNKIKYE